MKPYSVRLITSAALVLVCALGARVTMLARAPVSQAPAPPPGPGQTAGQRFKNVQILKDVPAEQLRLAMDYITASLGVGCDFCHVTGPGGAFDKDDKEPKQRARDMMKMMASLNTEQFEGRQTIGCMSCHNGRMRPTRSPGLAVEMTPEEAAVVRAGRGGRGGPGGPVGPGAAPGAAAARGAPAVGAGGPGGQGRGGRGDVPPPTETLNQVVAKFQQALGGKAALAKNSTRVLTGMVTSRDLQTSEVTVKETAGGAYRIDIASQPNPTVRVVNGTTGWTSGGFNNMVRDLEGLQFQQATRLADFTVPLHLAERYDALAVSRYGDVDGKATIVVTGRPFAGVTEQLQFERESGLLLRRSITTATPLGPLPEQIDYTDYRDVSGVKVPFAVRYVTWNAVTAAKFSDVKFNTPVGDEQFAKPAGAPQ